MAGVLERGLPAGGAQLPDAGPGHAAQPGRLRVQPPLRVPAQTGVHAEEGGQPFSGLPTYFLFTYFLLTSYLLVSYLLTSYLPTSYLLTYLILICYLQNAFKCSY